MLGSKSINNIRYKKFSTLKPLTKSLWQKISIRLLSTPSDPSNPRPIGIIEEDILHQQNSTDLIIRLKTVLQGFFSYNKINELYKISGEYAPLLWLSLSTNYLLTKYQFDVHDFHVGSKHAIKQLQLSIASKDFYNYINKYTNEKTVNDFMKVNLHPILFKGYVDAVSHLNSNKQMIIMKNIELLDVKLCAVDTYIVTDIIDEDVVVINDIEVPKRINYPVGSVICNVDVSFLAKSTYEYHLESEIKEEVKAGRSIWTFQSCISNHFPMSWIVTKFDGLGAN
jgi:hypothetical protein